MPRTPRWTIAAALCTTLLALSSVPAIVHARDTPAAVISTSALPKEAREVLAGIAEGGPYRYSRDGVVFGNRERLLPAEKRGYYHEYTVHTPGSHNRGARRIVCGGELKSTKACWYSDDHYVSFRKITP